MKKIIISLLIVAFTLNAFCQQTPNSGLNKTAADYLQKSKKQKAIAWAMLGVGAATVVAGILVPSGKQNEPELFSVYTPKYENTGTKVILYILGGGLIGTSIGFFDASGRNKYRALEASAFIDMERTQGMQASVVINQTFPALGVKIKF